LSLSFASFLRNQQLCSYIYGVILVRHGLV
jgi:hypothetical protein